MAVIRVPKTPKHAYNPQRPPGALLQNHLKHLEWAVRPAAERSPEKFQFKPAGTEGEAAARIAALTSQLHEDNNPPPIVPPGKRARSRKTGGIKRAKATRRGRKAR